MVMSTDSTLNCGKTALVIIDLQNRNINIRSLAPHSSSQVVANACRLTDAFERKGAFVVLVKVSTFDGNDILIPKSDMMRVPSKEPDDYVSELKKYKNAYPITKRQWGAFYGTDLDLQLRRRAIDTIVLCGISTSLGVDTTAREAYQLGYQQIFAEDAMTASTTEEHQYVCEYIFPRIGRVQNTEAIVKLLSLS